MSDMGLLQKAMEHQINKKTRKETMEKTALIFDAPEAAVALSAAISFADDDPSPEEGVILRRYYKLETAESVQQKLSNGGYLYPGELEQTEKYFLPPLQQATTEFRLRTIAVALLLAEADGLVDAQELRLLNRYCSELEVDISQAKNFAKTSLVEIDERGDYFRIPKTTDPSQVRKGALDLTPEEAGVALCAWVGFSDDDATAQEIGIIREQFSPTSIEALPKKMEESGLDYPSSLPALENTIMEVLKSVSREVQLKLLAIAWKVANADEKILPQEKEILDHYCQELLLGRKELEDFWKAEPEDP